MELNLRCTSDKKRVWFLVGKDGKNVVSHKDGTICDSETFHINGPRPKTRYTINRDGRSSVCPLVEGMFCQCGKPYDPHPLVCTIWKVELDGQARARQV